MNHMYMQSNRRKSKNSDYIRYYAPYGIVALVVIVLFWGVDSIKQDTERRQYEPSELVQPETGKDWTHKLSTAATYTDDKERPDDDTAAACPLPTGNWAHTCDRDLLVEGPCNGKCMLKARCKDLKEKFAETTLEYNEGRQLEAKNVNGLLCVIEDGTPSCGVNFHGNLALKNCIGYIPRRHEVMEDGLYADKEGDKEKDKDKEHYQEEPDDDAWKPKKKYDKFKDDAEDLEIRKPKRKRWGAEDADEGRRRRFAPVRENLAEDRDRPIVQRSFDEFDEVRPPKRAVAPAPYGDAPNWRSNRRSAGTGTDDEIVPRWDRFEGDEERRLRGTRRRTRYDGEDNLFRKTRGGDNE